MNLQNFLILFSAISFLCFGLACFIAPQMLLEFKRYGLSKYRRLVGGLQLLGSAGLLFGFFGAPKLQIAAAGGLSILMLLGFLVRLKIKDSALQSAPSLFYAVLNALIVYKMFLH